MTVSPKMFLLLLLPLTSLAQSHPPTPHPVLTSAAAIQAAKAALTPKYGKSTVESERPYTAQLDRGIWYVSGTPNCPTAKPCGAAEVKISKKDGHIISLNHPK
ncbi:MAG: NTF2 fold immunity protein [Granulicella sp.]